MADREPLNPKTTSIRPKWEATSECEMKIKAKDDKEVKICFGNETEEDDKRKADEDFAEDLESEDNLPQQDPGDIRNMRKMADPCLPTKAEVEEHRLTHLPYRNGARTVSKDVAW